MKNNQKGKIAIMLTAILAICLSFFIAQFAIGFAGNKKLSTDINDGPYIDIVNNEMLVRWVCQGQKKSKKYHTIELPFNFEQCGLKARVDSVNHVADNAIYRGGFDVIAISDIHGQFALMETLLQQHKVVDLAGNWIFGDGHLVITGDIFDRGDKVTETLWYLYRLEKLAGDAGGKIHLLLGNHEVMVLNQDLRYLHEKYQLVGNLFEQSFEELFSENSVLGAWLRSKSVLVKINNVLYMHGGFSPEIAKLKMSLAQINSTFKQSLVKKELGRERASNESFLHGTDGPIWYRGYFGLLSINEEKLDKILKHFNIDRIVVGHTSQEQVLSRYHGKVVAIDSSIKNGKNGEVLLINSDRLYRGYLNGKKSVLEMN